MDQKASAKVLVLDFGAQYGQLIARRVRDLNVYSEIVPCDISADEIREMNASALILSGGPASVYAEDAPSIDPAIFDLGLPVLGFCYGHQLTAVTLGGKVGHSEVGEYGRATITRTAGAKLFNSTPMEQTVWMSHRDAVSEVPEGFTVTASTDVCPEESTLPMSFSFFSCPAARDLGTSSRRWFRLPRKRREMSCSASTKRPSTNTSSRLSSSSVTSHRAWQGTLPVSCSQV